MNQTRYADLALIGTVQHGEQVPTQNGGKRAKELGHFIAKVPDSIMQGFLQKFKEQCEGKQYIEIAFCDDNPLIKKYVRYNQGGKACHCLEGSSTASQKVNNKWQQVECNKQCQYRKKDKNGKALCNRIGWLRFLIPSISQDKIWLSKITGQKSINRLDAFINLEKDEGTLLENRYILFLKQEEQTSQVTGQTFNNYILNIMLKKDFISANTIQETIQKQKNLSTKNTQNVNNNVEKEQKQETSKAVTTTNVVNIKQEKQKNQVPAEKTKPKEETKAKKQTKRKTKKAEETPKEQTTEKQEETAYNFDKCYIFDSLSSETITTTNGQKRYAVGKFYDTQDKTHNIIIKPEYETELQNCELGTVVEFQDIKEIDGRKFALDLKFIEKMQKNIVA